MRRFLPISRVAFPEGRPRIEAPWMTASSSDSTDLPEFPGIIRSVRLRPRVQGPA